MEKIKKRLYDQEYRVKHQERITKRIRKWKHSRPDRTRSYTKAWRDKNREKHNANAAKWRAKNIAKLLLYSARYRAAKFEISFNLTIEDIKIPKTCPILGIELFAGAKCSSNNSPTIDRVNPSEGYVKGNIAVISRKANDLKGDGTADQHRRIANCINKFNRRRGM